MSKISRYERDRQRNKLLEYRARITNPLTCPQDLYQACGQEKVDAELVWVDAELARLNALDLKRSEARRRAA